MPYYGQGRFALGSGTKADFNQAMDKMEIDPPMADVPVNPIEHFGDSK